MTLNASKIDILSGDIQLTTIPLTLNQSSIHIDQGSILLGSPSLAPFSTAILTDSEILLKHGDFSIFPGATTSFIVPAEFTGSTVTLDKGNFLTGQDLICSSSTLTIRNGSLSFVQPVELKLQQSSCILGTGNITGLALLTIENESTVKIASKDAKSGLAGSGSILLSTEGGSLLNPPPIQTALTVDGSSLIMESGTGGLSVSPASEIANFTFNSAIFTLASGIISNNATVSGTFEITNSSVLIHSPASLQAFFDLGIHGGTFTNHGIVTALGDILLDSGGTIINTGSLSPGGNLSVSGGSTLTTLGSVTVPGLYTQSADSILKIELNSFTTFGTLSAFSTDLTDLDETLLADLSNFSSLGVGSMTIVTTNDPFVGIFSSQEFINVPSTIIPHFENSTTEIIVHINPSPSVAGTVLLQNAIMMETFQTVNLNTQYLHSQLVTPTYSSDEGQDLSFLASNEEDFVAQNRPVEQLARREHPYRRPLRIYAAPIGSVGDVNSFRGQPSNSFWSIGGLAGADYVWQTEGRFPLGFGVGITGSYQTFKTKVDHSLGRSTLDFAHGNFYFTIVPQDFSSLSFYGSGGGGYQWLHLQRSSGTSAAPTTSHGKTEGPEFDAMVGLENIIYDGSFQGTQEGFHLIFPILNFQYCHTSFKSYQETGGGTFDVAVDKQTLEAYWGFLGARAHYVFLQTSNVLIIPGAGLGWQRQFNNPDQDATFTTLGSTPFTLNATSRGPRRNTLIFNADLKFQLYDRCTIEFDYDLFYNKAFLNNAFMLQVATMF